MLLTLLMNLSMYGSGPTPPTPPTPTGQGGGEGGHFRDERGEDGKKWMDKLIRDDEDAIWMAGSWLIDRNNN